MARKPAPKSNRKQNPPAAPTSGAVTVDADDLDAARISWLSLHEEAMRRTAGSMMWHPDGEAWTWDETDSDTSRVCHSAAVASEHYQQLKSAAGTVAELKDAAAPEYRPGRWFGKTLTARLRMASAPKRKTMQVRKRTIDGVVCYHVADARRWWPNDVPSDAK